VGSAWLEEFQLSKNNVEIVAALIAVKIAATFLGIFFLNRDYSCHKLFYRPKETVHLHTIPLPRRPTVCKMEYSGRIARAAGNAQECSRPDGQRCMGIAQDFSLPKIGTNA
jgi:hypothetical protein